MQPLSRSRVTSQGQISIPAEVRKKLGIGPGSVLEWSEEDDRIVVRRAGTYSSSDIHRAMFPDQAPKPRKFSELKQGIRQAIRKRHALR